MVLKCADEDEMLNIASNAKKMGVAHYIVRDAGHTQVDPGSRTVLSLGPNSNADFDQLTGHLKLL